MTDVDKEYTRITNGIRDAVMPDVTMFVRSTVWNSIRGNTVLLVSLKRKAAVTPQDCRIKWSASKKEKLSLVLPDKVKNKGKQLKTER